MELVFRNGVHSPVSITFVVATPLQKRANASLAVPRSALVGNQNNEALFQNKRSVLCWASEEEEEIVPGLDMMEVHASHSAILFKID